MVGVIAGIARLAWNSPGLCFVDTDGWVEGGAAGVYKSELIDVLEPDKLMVFLILSLAHQSLPQYYYVGIKMQYDHI